MTAVAIAVVLVSIVASGRSGDSPACQVEASAFIDRPVHASNLGVNVGRGRLIVEDLVVDGITNHDPGWSPGASSSHDLERDSRP
ncbi:MAG: hypothetical protein R2708_13665 [Vicinamibacterales bacterium]